MFPFACPYTRMHSMHTNVYTLFMRRGTYKHVYVCGVYLNMFVYVYVYVYYICKYVYLYVNVSVYVYVYVSVYVYAYVYA